MPSWKILLILLVVSLVLKIYFTGFGIYHVDLITFQLWSLDLIRYGFGKFYSMQHSIYPPGYLYFLWAVGKIYYWLVSHSVVVSAELMFKLPSIVADSFNGILIYLIGKKIMTEKNALIAAGVALFNPAFFMNSTYWGQIDGFVSFFLLVSLYFLIRGNLWLSAITIGICQAIKPYAIISLPVFLLYLHLKKVSLRRLAAYSLICLFTIIVLFIPFNTGNILGFIVDRYLTGLEEWPAATSNAFNFWAIVSIVGFGSIEKVTDAVVFLGVSYRIWGTLIFGGIYIGLIAFFARKFKQTKNKLSFVVTLLVLGYSAMFLFMTRMHERHFYYGLIFMVIIFPLLRYWSRVAIFVVFFMYVTNLYYAYRLATQPIFYLSSPVIAAFSVVNVLVFIFLLRDFFKSTRD